MVSFAFVLTLLFACSSAQTQLGKVGAWDGGGDQFGWSIGLSGNMLAVGAPGKNYYQGAVYLYRCDFVNSMFPCNPYYKLLPPAEGRHHFGYSVSLEGAMLVVGAPQQHDFAGGAYVFYCNNSRCDLKTSLLAPTGEEEGDFYGQSVSLNRERIAVGEYLRVGGVVYTYYCPAGNCVFQQEILPTDLARGDYFGNYVALSGDLLAVGATAQNDFHGSVYVYHCDQFASCTQFSKLVPFNSLPNGWFGASIHIYGESMVIGAHHERDMRGTAYVFHCHNATCHEFDKLWHSDSSSDDAFGNAVGLLWHDNSHLVVIGSPSQSDEIGGVYTYSCGSVICDETGKLKANDGNPGDFFGASLLVTEDRKLLIGAHGEAAVYLYSLV